VIGASLSRPFFGLSATAFDELAVRVGAILHLAAKVDLHGSFKAHRTANVDGVVEILRLAFRARARLIFASTTDVLPSGCGDDEPAASVLPDKPETDGYALSKLVGERLVETAVERGLAANIVRLGFVGGSSESGVCNPKDFLCRLLIGMERAELDGALSVWPVLSWAKGQEHFPAFNSRSARPSRLLKLLEADGALLARLSWSGPELERVIHGMLRHLFE
jgi:thioester reductase-like protein